MTTFYTSSVTHEMKNQKEAKQRRHDGCHSNVIFLPLSHFHRALWVRVCPILTIGGSPLIVFSQLVGQRQMALWAAGSCREE